MNLKEKSLDVHTPAEALQKVPDIKKFGDADKWYCIAKVSSDSQGFMKSTKAFPIPNAGVLVQVTTQQKNIDLTWSIAEALQFIPNITIVEEENGTYWLRGASKDEIENKDDEEIIGFVSKP